MARRIWDGLVKSLTCLIITAILIYLMISLEWSWTRKGNMKTDFGHVADVEGMIDLHVGMSVRLRYSFDPKFEPKLKWVELETVSS